MRSNWSHWQINRNHFLRDQIMLKMNSTPWRARRGNTREARGQKRQQGRRLIQSVGGDSSLGEDRSRGWAPWWMSCRHPNPDRGQRFRGWHTPRTFNLWHCHSCYGCCSGGGGRRRDVSWPAPGWGAWTGRTPSSSGSGQTAAGGSRP